MGTQKIKYLAYCRKSSESEDRQIASIEDQKRELLGFAKREGLQIVHMYEESQSAHKRGRPIFAEMMAKIESGEANGLLVWHLNRLARNAFDGGWIITDIDETQLVEIRTPSRTYINRSDDKFMIQLELGMAKKDSDDKGVAVKRAYKGKLEKGWRPGPAPIGYMNIGDVGNKTIVPDTMQFNLVRQMWDLFLTGTYSVSKILKIATNDWSLRTTPKKKLGGRPLTMSHMYAIFNNPFYYSDFWFRNPETGIKELYKGSHQPMITEQEFNRAQTLLGKKGKPQPKTKDFAFTGLMRCGECSSMICAEEKHQVICSGCKYKFASQSRTACPQCHIDISAMHNPVILHYIYYHCTKKKNPNCSQKSIRLEKLEAQFDQVLSGITIDEDYLKLALEYLKGRREIEVTDETSITKSLRQSFDNCQTRLNNLHREYLSPQNSGHTLYSTEEFKHCKDELLKERADLEQKLNGSTGRIDRTNDLAERTFNFCAYARRHFNTGTIQQKRDIFANIGSNLTLMDQQLKVQALDPYMLVENELKAQRTLYAALEPEKNNAIKGKEAVSSASIPSLLRR